MTEKGKGDIFIEGIKAIAKKTGKRPSEVAKTTKEEAKKVKGKEVQYETGGGDRSTETHQKAIEDALKKIEDEE